jgi:hypothetical protein
MLSPATLRRRHLNETVSARGGVRLRIVERPGLWMSPEELARIVADLQAVVATAVPGGDLAYGAASGDTGRLDASILTIAYDRGGRAIGFNALSLMDCELRGQQIEVLHLGLVVIDPAQRTSGLAGVLYGLTAFLLFARRQMRPLWISNVTQVPAVFGMVSEAFDSVYPTSDPANHQRYDHAHLARQIMSRYRFVFGVGEEAEYDERRGVITNAYTGGSDNLKKGFEDAPKHRKEQHNDTCRRELDYDRGDDFLQIGQVTLRAARSYFTRSSSVISPGALAMQFGTRVLESLVAPLVQWFDARRQMGDLRPAQ